MATCGNCKAEGQTVEHVRGCYSNSGTTLTKPTEVTGFAAAYVASVPTAADFQPMALTVPDSKYALVGNDDVLRFYEVRTGKKAGKWFGVQFLDLLVGAPGDWNHYPVKGDSKKAIMAEVNKAPLAAALRYSTEFTRCAVCESPLSDPESIAAGIGPVCATRF